MKQILLLILLASGITISAIAQAKDDRVKAEIRAVMEAQAAAWNRGDIEGYMQGYWKSEQMTFVSGDSVSRGWQAAFDRYRKRYDSRAKMGVLTFSDLEMNILSKDSATVLGSWALQRESDNPKGKFTLIFRKFKNGWKIVHDHTS